MQHGLNHRIVVRRNESRGSMHLYIKLQICRKNRYSQNAFQVSDTTQENAFCDVFVLVIIG